MVIIYYWYSLYQLSSAANSNQSALISSSDSQWYSNHERHTIHDLPLPPEPFVGRDADVNKLTTELLTGSAHIVNINGPPAYGKSTLAIHVGHKVFTSGINVRYIDVIEHYIFLQDDHHHPDLFQDDSAVDQYRNFGVNQYYDQEKHKTKSRDEIYSVFAIELQKWAKTVKTPTVLILDNCDNLLQSSDKRKFIYSVKTIIKLAHYKLKVIITSQKHVRFLDDFLRYQIAELSPPMSIKLLRKKYPLLLTAASNETIFRMVSAAGHCPLALKVIGSLLNESRTSISVLLDELERRPIPVISDSFEEVDRFEYLMSVAYQYLSGDTKECGHYLSFFPGSFELTAGKHILKQINSTYDINCINGLIRQSLLDEFLYGPNLTMSIIRLRMYRLVREYFGQSHFATNGQLAIKMDIFFESYRTYYSHYIVRYSNSSNYKSPNEIEEYRFLSDSHNFLLLFNILTTSSVNSASEVTALCFGLRRGYLISMSNTSIVKIVYRLLQNLEYYEAVCDSITLTECSKFYIDILNILHNAYCSEWNCSVIPILWTMEECEIFKCSHVSMSLQYLTTMNSSYKETTIFEEMSLASDLCTAAMVLLYLPFIFIGSILGTIFAKIWKVPFILLSITTLYYTFYLVTNLITLAITQEIDCWRWFVVSLLCNYSDYILIVLGAVIVVMLTYRGGLLNSLYNVCATICLIITLYFLLYNFSVVILSTLIIVYFVLPFVVIFYIATDFQLSVMALFFFLCLVVVICLPFVTYFIGSPIFDID